MVGWMSGWVDIWKQLHQGSVSVTSLFPSQVVVLFVLSFTYHRVHLWKNVLWGVPGLVMYVPN